MGELKVSVVINEDLKLCMTIRVIYIQVPQSDMASSTKAAVNQLYGSCTASRPRAHTSCRASNSKQNAHQTSYTDEVSLGRVLLTLGHGRVCAQCVAHIRYVHSKVHI